MKKARKEKKDSTINVRVPPSTLRSWEMAASSEGLSVSSWIRRIVLSAAEKRKDR